VRPRPPAPTSATSVCASSQVEAILPRAPAAAPGRRPLRHAAARRVPWQQRLLESKLVGQSRHPRGYAGQSQVPAAPPGSAERGSPPDALRLDHGGEPASGPPKVVSAC
jgi:hypothetical protein